MVQFLTELTELGMVSDIGTTKNTSCPYELTVENINYLLVLFIIIFDWTKKKEKKYQLQLKQLKKKLFCGNNNKKLFPLYIFHCPPHSPHTHFLH